MIDERFLYEIHPHRPIKALIPGRAIIKPCSMKLTKSEVITCMAGGPVFRLFPGKDPIRVVGSNLNQLHVSKFEEYEKSTKSHNQTLNAENDARATVGVSEEPKTEAPTAPVVEEKPVEVETEKVTEPEPIPVPVEPGPVIIPEVEKEEDPDPIPIPVEPGPVIVEEEKEEEPVPVVVEPGPVIIEETVEEDDEEEEETTDEEQKPSSSVNPVTVNLSNKKHKKNRH